ncbi:aminotransferase class I/II-fold pyridoxal phosphate-dependent enzyme [Pseudarthrobacter sulfonivorans]|uniref:aminotransferase class I/II-fold pyridoxal phosphate-dependent enzyme n=1 Tax=Pseudarthrobacter sulfonivorans TaxID=121292 RepID=UPI0021032E68|nr:PLP-dependent aminotransferase family protein [Pseudarthrobacter sulfonivorans]
MESEEVSADGTYLSAAWLSAQISEPSASGIASAVTQLIRAGEVPAGVQLPTVRALAARLAVSPGTVSAAWNMLRKQRVIEGSGRQGIRVLERPALLAPQRFENVSRYWQGGVLDLTLAAPDPLLLPDLAKAVASAAPDPDMNSYRRPGITPALEGAVKASWGWEPESWLAVNGGYEGIILLVSSSILPGQHVAVADPSTPRLLDILELAGAVVVPVATDADGPLPESLKQALAKQPVAFIYEPCANSRSGTNMTPARRDLVADVLRGTRVLIVEDDGLGELALGPYAGLGALLPAQTVQVRSYSKSHGPDLRLAVMGGPSEPLERARLYRQFGAGWTSRILQNALAWMLTSDAVKAQVEHARARYAERRTQMAMLLAERGVQVESHDDGLGLWVRVLNEQQALLVLASHGVASGGSSGGSIRSQPPSIRLAIGRQLDRPEEIADLYAMASRAL